MISAGYKQRRPGQEILVHTGAAQDKRYWLGRLLPDLRRAPSVPPRAAGASQLRMLPSGE